MFPSHHLPVPHSASNTHSAQTPDAQIGVAVPAHVAHEVPQWVASEVPHVSHAPSWHQLPASQSLPLMQATHSPALQCGTLAPQSVSWVHWTQAPAVQTWALVPVHTAHDDPQWSASSSPQGLHTLALHQEPEVQSVSFPHSAQAPSTQ